MFSFYNFKSFIIFVAISVFCFGNAVAQSFDAAVFCPIFTEKIDSECDRMGKEECQKALEKCEKYFQEKSEEYQSEISTLKNKKQSLEKEISTLNSQISNLKYKINKNNIIIKDLGFQIDDTQKSIESTSVKIEEVREKLGITLQLRHEEDSKSVLEIFLEEKDISGFFDNIMALESLNLEIQSLLFDIKNLKNSLEGQKNLMVSEKTDLEHTQIIVGLQKEESESLKRQKNTLLEKTKGQESLYQQYLNENEAKANEIRKKRFELAQISETESLTLEQAYILAKEVSKTTGIRPAFLLGLLKVESDIGNNVGQCNCSGQAYCRYPEITWTQVMPKKHWSDFEKITKELGMDPNKTPVSCAVSGGKVQWGGAMGPAQFMPGTWLGLGYKKRVEKTLGVSPANPWRVKDAFMAASLYLYDWGASSQKELNEISAARAYLCGTTKLTLICQIAGGASYASNVMKYASQFQDYVNRGILK